MNDEWIEWNGGDRPVSSETRVAIKTRNGMVEPEVMAHRLKWSHSREDSGAARYDIIAYRVLPPPPSA